MTPHMLVVGAGIGGLTLAHALRRRRLRVTVVERATELRPVGAGLVLAGNATRTLAALGPGARVLAAGHPLRGLLLADGAGRALQRLDYGHDPALGRAVALHRATLQAVLLQGVEDAVRFGTTVGALRDGPRGVEVALDDGTEGRFDAVVGADGVRSSVRALAFGNARPGYAGYTTWRAIVPGRVLDGEAAELWGPGRRAGVVPIDGDRTYLYFTANAPEGGRDDGDPVFALRARFADFGGPVPAALAALRPGAAVVRTDVHEVVLPRWTRGRVALLGDAAHAMTPNLGQGAGMAIEDAAVLADAIAATPDLPTGLRAYEARRRRRVDAVQRQARLLGVLGQLEHPLGRAARDALLRATPDASARRNLRALLSGAPTVADAGAVTG